jgi:hypothetical protein
VVRLGLLIDRLLAYSSGLLRFYLFVPPGHLMNLSVFIWALWVSKKTMTVIFSFWVWSLQALLPSTETEITV